MNFINPNAFYALFSVLIVILLYFLKLKRDKKMVSNLFLFNKVLIDQRANRPFRRLRNNLLLLIQILFLLVAIFALSRPTFIKDIFSNFNYIVIIDSSASMRSVESGSESRFDIAKKRALELVDSFGGSDMAMVISADSKTQIVSTLTHDKRILKKSIKGLKASEAPADMYEAFIVAISVVKQKKIDKIYVISDGAHIGLERLDAEHKIDHDEFPKVEFVSVGHGSDNVGIVRLDINSVAAEENYQVFARLKNFSEKPVTADLELYNADRLIDVKELNISPSQSVSVIFDGLTLEKGLLHLKLQHDDALKSDNEVYAYVKKPEKVKVLLVSDESLFLEKVLSVNRAVSLVTLTPAEYDEEADYSEHDIVIYNMYSPKKAPDTNLLLINTPLSALGINIAKDGSGADKIEAAPEIIDYDKTHRVMKYVDFENTAIKGATIFDVPDWFHRVVETKHSAVVYAGEQHNRRIVLLAFDLNDSDFILQSSFPIFFYNSIFYLSDHFDKRLSSFYKTGEPVNKHIFGDKSVKVTTPDGSIVELKIFNDEFFFDDTRSVGLYTMKGDAGYKDFFITNLLDEEESDILPSPYLTIGGKKIAPTGMITTRKEFYKLFAGFAMLLILIEWWVYHRKVLE